jgi:hypothetical protein
MTQTTWERELSVALIEPQMRLYKNASPYNLTIGGQGSGKSHNIGIVSGMFIETCPQIIGLIAANTYDQLSRATLLETFATWKSAYGYSEYDAKTSPSGCFVVGKEPPAHFKPHGYTFLTNNNNIYFWNGAVIFTASLENYKAIEGVNIGWACLDETADTREEALTSVITGRLRQKGLCVAKKKILGFFPYCPKDHPDAGEEINPLFIFTKPAKAPWLKDLFLLEQYKEEIQRVIYDPKNFYYHFDGVRQVIVYSVYWNKINLPNGFIKNRLSLLHGSGLIGSHIFGDPFGKTGGEFATEWDSAKHIRNVDLKEGYPIHFSIDFNAKPYMTGLVCQITQETGNWNGKTSWIRFSVVDAYALASPKNSAGHLAQELMADYQHVTDFGLFIYGDASGNNEVAVKNVTSYFQDFTNHLRVKYELRVPNSNPRYKAALGPGSMGRKAFLNRLLSGALGVEVVVSPRCVELIADMNECEEDENGRLKKKKNKDGIEERGHNMDAFQYIICHPKALGYLAKIKGI